MGSLSITSRAEIEQFAEHLEGLNEPAPLFPSGHFFCEGIYQRTTFLPRGSIVVGLIHKHSTINTVVGKCLATNPEQPEMNTHLVGLTTFESPAGSRRLVMALEDTYWITVHRSDATDLDTLAKEFTATSYEELTLEEKSCLGAL